MGTQAAARTAYDLAFQISPIILHGGIASSATGGMLPIIALIGELAGFAEGMLTNGFSMDDFAIRFRPMSGGTIISQAVATYPFANQQVAANATIQQPKNISLRMLAPTKNAFGYLSKLPLFSSMQASLEQHNNAGGTYHIATPAYIYKDCLLLDVTDITGGWETKQDQVEWQWNFAQPLVTGEQAAAAFGGLLSRLSGGQQVTSNAWSGAQAAVGNAIQGAEQALTGLVSGVPGAISSLTSNNGGNLAASQ